MDVVAELSVNVTNHLRRHLILVMSRSKDEIMSGLRCLNVAPIYCMSGSENLSVSILSSPNLIAGSMCENPVVISSP